MKIIIQGLAAEGKTTVAHIIARALKDAGFGVINNDPDATPLVSTTAMDLQARRLDVILGRDTVIDIEVAQTKR